MRQIETFLLQRHYDGFLKKGRIRGRSDTGAREAVWNVLFLRGSARGFYLDVVKREFPWLSARYEALYARGTRAESEYREGIERLVERLARESGLAGLTREDRVRREAPARPRQLELAW